MYATLFNRALPVDGASRLDAASALRLLLAGGALDAVLLIGDEARDLLAKLTAQQRSELRLTQVDPERRATRLALRSYLLKAPPNSMDTPGKPVLAGLTYLVAWGPVSEGDRAVIDGLTRALCERIDTLRRTGDRRWHEVRPGLEIPVSRPGASTIPTLPAWSKCR